MYTQKKFILFSIVLLFGMMSAKAQLLDSLTLDTTTAYTDLATALKNPEKVIKLELRKKNLKQFPLEILKFKNIQYLDLSKNKITELPEGIEELKDLQYLLLSKNKLVKLPKQIGELSQLKYLNVNQNELESIPAQLGKLENLLYVDLWSNNIDEFPEEIKYMKSLKTLDLRVILISDAEQARLKNLLPNTKIYFSPNCKCQL